MENHVANWRRLRETRRRLRVSQAELARAMGLRHQAVHRRELPEDHPDHVAMSNGELLEWIAKAQQIVEKRALTPADLLDA